MVEIVVILQHLGQFWPDFHCAYAKMAIDELPVKCLTPSFKLVSPIFLEGAMFQ